MSWGAKSSLIAFWLLFLIAFFLWYRNILYDRIIASLILLLSLIQLVEYGVYSGMDNCSAGELIFLFLWLQPLLLAVGVYIFFPNITTITLLIIYLLIFIWVLIYTLLGNSQLAVLIGNEGQIEWYEHDNFIFGNWLWLYLVGLILPFIIMIYYSGDMWYNIGLFLLLLYGLATAIYSIIYYSEKCFASVWSYLLIGFGFIAWMIGIFYPC